MASIKQFRKKIKSAKNIAKITSAMELVAASKMKRAQVAALSGKEYAKGMLDLSGLLSSYLDPALHALLVKTQKTEALNNFVVVIAPQKGLCGSLVTNLMRRVVTAVSEKDKERTEFITIGKKAKELVAKLGGVIIADFEIGLSIPKYELVPPMARLIEEKFIKKEAGRVTFIYSEFVNTMIQAPTERIILPLDLAVQETLRLDKDYLFEPSAKDIVDPFLEMYLEVEIYQMLLEAYASEQSARMVAMKNATDNANALIDQLTVTYNKARQSAITDEILDITNAGNALIN